MEKLFFLFLLGFLFLLQTILFAQKQIISKVGRVIDGDTFVLTNGERVRLLGVDTPELTSQDSVSRNLAFVAFAHTREMIDGRNVKLTFEPFSPLLRGRTQ